MVTRITDVAVPAGAFPLGRIFDRHPGVAVELERLVPMGTATVPLFWVESIDEVAVEAALEGDPTIEDVRRLTRADGKVLYSVTWRGEENELMRALSTANVDVLSGEGTADAWRFRLQFRRRGDLRRFREDCLAAGIEMTLLELFNPKMPFEKGPLTSEEKDVLATAFENGYWDVPRETSQRELASLVGLREDRFSERRRAGEKAAVGELLYGAWGSPTE